MHNLVRKYCDILTLVIVAILSLSLLGIVLLGSHSAARLETLLDQNWRGGYDILVLPSNPKSSASTEGTPSESNARLVDSNFVSNSGMGGISESQLQAIRDMSAVEVAGPIGFVGRLDNLGFSPFLKVQDHIGSGPSNLTPNKTSLIHINSETILTTDRGEITLGKAEGNVALKGRSQEPKVSGDEFVRRSGQTPDATGFPAGFSPQGTEEGYTVPMGTLPQFSTGVIAVDPVAEMQLTHGMEFLQKLVDIPQDRSVESAQKFGDLVPETPFTLQNLILKGTTRESAPVNTAAHEHLEVVPLVANRSLPKNFKITVKASLSGREVDQEPMQQAALLDSALAAAPLHPLGNYELDVTSAVLPFASPDLAIQFRQGQPESGSGFLTSSQTTVNPLLTGAPEVTGVNSQEAPDSIKHNSLPGTSAQQFFTVHPQGTIDFTGTNPVAASASDYGSDFSTSTVRSYRDVQRPQSAKGLVVAPAPLGTFTDADLPGPSQAASYVPWGAYSTDTTTLLDGPHAGEPYLPNLSGTDIVTPTPGGFTDLEGGKTIRGATPIDAIRVRAKDVTSYTPEAQGRITALAGKISQLGLEARVVAGSSLQPINLLVPKANGTPGSVDNQWVQQEWTTLGAAIQVENAFSGLNLNLSWLCIAFGVVALLLTTLIHVERRRVQVTHYQRLGWSAPFITKTLAKEQSVPLALILVVTAALWVLDPAPHHVRIACLVVLAATVLTTVLGIFLATHSGRAGRRATWGTAGIFTMNPFSKILIPLRRLGSRPIATLTQVGGLAVSGVSLGLVCGSILTHLGEAGATRLATLATNTLLLGIALLGACSFVAAVFTMLVARTFLARLRDASDRQLARIGFSHTVIRRLSIQELAMIAGAALVLCFLLALLLSWGSPVSVLVILASLAGTLLTGCVLFFTIRPAKLP